MGNFLAQTHTQWDKGPTGGGGVCQRTMDGWRGKVVVVVVALKRKQYYLLIKWNRKVPQLCHNANIHATKSDSPVPKVSTSLQPTSGRQSHPPLLRFYARVIVFQKLSHRKCPNSPPFPSMALSLPCYSHSLSIH